METSTQRKTAFVDLAHILGAGVPVPGTVLLNAADALESYAASHPHVTQLQLQMAGGFPAHRAMTPQGVFETSLKPRGWKMRADSFTKSITPIHVGACTRTIELTSEREAADHLHVLRECSFMCPAYMNPTAARRYLQPGRSILILMATREGVEEPCAAAFLAWDDPAAVHLAFLCFAVPSTGKRVFDSVMAQAATRKKAFMTLVPANKKLGLMYRQWAGKAFVTWNASTAGMMVAVRQTGMGRKTWATKTGIDVTLSKPWT